jgi:hypothetical protein
MMVAVLTRGVAVAEVVAVRFGLDARGGGISSDRSSRGTFSSAIGPVSVQKQKKRQLRKYG